MARFVTQSAHAGVTAIDNAFIIDYMPTAPDGAVKAYIYGLMAASRGDAPDIADALGMDDAQLSDAFAYWQRLGLVRIASGEPLIVEFLKTESIAPAERTRRYASLIERLSKAVPGRVFTGSELSAICDWIEVFGFSEETAALVVSDCARRRGSRVKLWQMNAEAKAWADANVSTMESALEYIAKRDERIAGAQKILSRWKLRRAATEDELALYAKWKEEWGLSDGEQEVVEQMRFIDDAHIDIEVEAALPDAYVSQQAERLKLYRELDSTKDEEALQAFESRLADRFGPLPRAAKELLNVVRLRWEAIRLGMERVKVKNGLMIVHFVGEENSPFYKSEAFMTLLQRITQRPDRFVLKQHNNRLAMTVRNVKDVEDAYKTLQQL